MIEDMNDSYKKKFNGCVYLATLDVKKITDSKNYNKYSIFSKKIWSWNKGRESESINRL